MASPRTVCGPKDSATPFSGWPSKRSRKISDHATVKPQLAGTQRRYRHALGSQRFHPSAVGAQPRPARAAERQHRRAGIDGACGRPAFETARPSASQPLQRCRNANRTPIASSRRSHARSNGDALKPSETPCRWSRQMSVAPAPRSRRATRPAETPRSRLRDATRPRRSASEIRQRFAVRQIESAAPGHQELAARRRHRVVDGDAGAAAAPAPRPPSGRRDRRR